MSPSNTGAGSPARPAKADSRTVLAAAATLALLGIGMSVLDDGQAIGSVLTVVSLLVLIGGMHHFGRSGADAPLSFQVRKKKRSRKKPAS